MSSTDGRTRWIQYYPPPTSLGGGIVIIKQCVCSKYHFGHPIIQGWTWNSTKKTQLLSYVYKCLYTVYKFHIVIFVYKKHKMCTSRQLWSKVDWYLNTTKHNKARCTPIIHGIYCTFCYIHCPIPTSRWFSLAIEQSYDSHSANKARMVHRMLRIYAETCLNTVI